MGCKFDSSELQILLSACFQVEPDHREDNYDQGYLKALVKYHGVRPQVLNYLHKNNLNPNLQKALTLDCQEIAISNLLAGKELGRLSATLANNGIPCYAYKGSLWAEWLYGDVGKREFGDIDVLIEPRSFSQAIEVLKREGYLPDAYRQYLLGNNVRKMAYFRTDYHMPLENSTVTAASMLEVHWQVAYPRLCFDFPPEEWTAYRQGYDLKYALLNGFQNEYQFLLLLVHHGGKEQWSRIKYIADAAAYMNRYGAITDWELVQNLARRKGIYKLFVTSMELLKSLGLPWRPEWPVIADNSPDPAPLVKAWKDMPSQTSNSSWPYFIQGLAIHDGLKYKSKVLLEHLKYLSEWRLLYNKMQWYAKNRS